jgi:primase-polymerase (primpol)-like protein
MAAYEIGEPFAGIGFVLTPDDPFAGIDLDHCRDPETGEIEPWASEIVDRFQSYTEISPSGAGIRIFIRGTLPAGKGRHRGRVEVYDRGRFLTVTGQRLEGSRARR